MHLIILVLTKSIIRLSITYRIKYKFASLYYKALHDLDLTHIE